LPLSATAYHNLRRNRLTAGLAAVGGLALLITGLVGFAGPITGFAALVGVIVILVGLVRFGISDYGYPKVELDGSRRWVTIDRVHPDFVAAVQSSTASEGAADRA
jgi:hypothetical protein